MLRVLIIAILAIVVIRAVGRLLGGVYDGMIGRQTGARTDGVAMVRDPVCGTFVVPSRALSLTDGRQQLYFCSDRCRDAYRAKSA
jgi:uncharacterized protein